MTTGQTKNVNVKLRVDEDMAAALIASSLRNSRTVAGEIRLAIRLYLEQQEKAA